MSTHKRFWVVGAVAALGVLAYMQFQNDAASDMTARGQMAPQPDPQQVGALTFSPDVQGELDVCFRCHGEDGVSLRPAYPTIAGQKPDYILSQLQTFLHTGEEASDQTTYANAVGDSFDALRTMMPHRSNLAMNNIAKSVPSALLNSVVQAISSLPCDGGKARAKAAEQPAMPTKANRCIVCHGQDGISREPSIPNLAGQHQAYLRRELQMIRDSALGRVPVDGLPSRSHPMMAAQAEHLTDTDIDDITHYFAALDCRGRM